MTKSKARQRFQTLQKPSVQTGSAENRQAWIDHLCEGFVCPSKANKAYYRVVVEKLWPEGHGIPGPYVIEDEIREAINEFRSKNRFGANPDKPYVDVFRRVRELQGEEGLKGVGRQGKTYQLVNLEIGEKRVPRTKLSDINWIEIKQQYNDVCAVCKKSEPAVRLQQDHKIPRTREGDDDLSNWQPLCDECNNFKSVSCRGCTLDCAKCCWAFPEKYQPIVIPPESLNRIYEYCETHRLDANNFVSKLINSFLDEK